MSLLDNIQNYYEHLVMEALVEEVQGKSYDNDVLTDVVCIALNHLPPRYIRHEVDMVYYTSPEDRAAIANKARKAVVEALNYIETRQRA